jgi:hypothetical protein
MALSVGFRVPVSQLQPCYPSYGAPTLTPVGLSPTGRASLRWTHIGRFRATEIRYPLSGDKSEETSVALRPVPAFRAFRKLNFAGEAEEMSLP